MTDSTKKEKTTEEKHEEDEGWSYVNLSEREKFLKAQKYFDILQALPSESKEIVYETNDKEGKVLNDQEFIRTHGAFLLDWLKTHELDVNVGYGFTSVVKLFQKELLSLNRFFTKNYTKDNLYWRWKSCTYKHPKKLDRLKMILRYEVPYDEKKRDKIRVQICRETFSCGEDFRDQVHRFRAEAQLIALPHQEK